MFWRSRRGVRANQEDLAESRESASEHSAYPGLNEAALVTAQRSSGKLKPVKACGMWISAGQAG